MQDREHIADDMLSHFYPNGMSRWDKFFEYVLPWLIFLAIVVGIFFMFDQLLTGMLLLLMEASDTVEPLFK